jgi:hypothetical protein
MAVTNARTVAEYGIERRGLTVVEQPYLFITLNSARACGKT